MPPCFSTYLSYVLTCLRTHLPACLRIYVATYLYKHFHL